jgi:hypothetical protein
MPAAGAKGRPNEEINGEPAFVDSRGKRRTALAVLAAVAMTGVWAAILHGLATAGHRYDPLTESYYSGRAIGVFGMAGLIACVASLFRGRTWTRFLAVYAAVLALNLPAQLIRPERETKDAEQKAARRIQVESITQRAASVGREQQRLLDELRKVAPISPEGLSSVEAIATAENRLGGLVNVLDVSDRLADEDTSSSLAPGGQDADLGALLRRQRQTRRNQFQAARELLRYLRMTWGRWQFDPGSRQVRCSSDDDQRHMDELNQAVGRAEAETAQMDDQVRARAPETR